LDVIPESRDGISRLGDLPGTVTEPHTAAEVAKIFLKRVSERSHDAGYDSTLIEC